MSGPAKRVRKPKSGSSSFDDPEQSKRFIEAARPTDRLAIVTFASETEVVCPLTADRSKLIAGAKRIEGFGGTLLWDALKLTLDNVVGPRTMGRRRAVVVMTDGVDNALDGGTSGSEISFADLLEAVRKSDELIIPIYLDTENDQNFTGGFRARTYENARKTLALLAQESGGLYYSARKINDLNGVYDQVINDLGKVYSLGYKPTNEKRDGSWRRVQIQIANRPDLSARSRPGYWARTRPTIADSNSSTAPRPASGFARYCPGNSTFSRPSYWQSRRVPQRPRAWRPGFRRPCCPAVWRAWRAMSSSLTCPGPAAG